MRALGWVAIVAVIIGAYILGTVRDVPAPLVGSPQCEQPADGGFCYFDLSDGREYVVYVDGNRLVWYEQDWEVTP